MSARVLCARLDGAGDVLLTGPAVRAVAAHADDVVFLAGPRGGEAARLLPGICDVVVWQCPWVDLQTGAVDRGDVAAFQDVLARLNLSEAVIFTSFHQSPLPLALLLRLAGVTWISAISVDFPGALLDVRHQVDDNIPEAERALSLVAAAGYRLPDGDSGCLAVRQPLPDVSDLVADRPYVVLHPGASAPARQWPAERFAEAAGGLADAGWQVVVTGGWEERALTAEVSAAGATDLGGRIDLAHTAAVIAGASAIVVGNTGPAHLAAAVQTPVVSLFSPVVPAVRWAPYRVRTVLLGDQNAPCRDTRATACPIPGHPCLATVSALDVVAAVEKLAGLP